MSPTALARLREDALHLVELVDAYGRMRDVRLQRYMLDKIADIAVHGLFLKAEWSRAPRSRLRLVHGKKSAGLS
jgi:hypothetical protein